MPTVGSGAVVLVPVRGAAAAGGLTVRLDVTAALVDTFDGAFALFLEATRAEAGAFDARTHAERRIPAESEAAERIRSLTCESGWMTEDGRKRMGADHPRIHEAARRGGERALAPLDDDRHMSPDLEQATTLVRDGVLAGAVRVAASGENRCVA